MRAFRFVAVVLTLLALGTMGTVIAQEEPDPVRFIIQPLFGLANTFVAEGEGYYDAQGIAIERIELETGNDGTALTMLLNGEVDVVQFALSPGLINAILRGGEAKIVAASGYNDPEACSYWSFFAAEGNGGENFDPESLRGAVVAVPDGVTRYYLYRLLERYDLTLDDVILDGMPGAVRGEAVANGAVVLGWTSEPRISQFRRLFGVEDLAAAADLMPNAELGLLVFGPSMLERDPEVLVRFLTAYLQGSRQVNEGQTDRNIELLSEALSLEPADLLDTCWLTFRENGEVNRDAASDYMEWLFVDGQIDALLDLDILIDMSYARQAVAILDATTEATPEADATAAPGG